MVKMKDDIFKALARNHTAIEQFGVRKLGLFGSCAREEQVASSDLDFLVEFEHKSFDAYMGLKILLEDLFEKRVDLVIADALKSRLRENITKELINVPGF